MTFYKTSPLISGYFISLIAVERFSVVCVIRIKLLQYTKYQLLQTKNISIAFKSPFKSDFFLWLWSFKENEPKTNYPSTLHAVFLDRTVRWSGSDSAGLRGKWEIPPLHWAANMLPTDVVISHWNLNQTINIRQLSCSKKQRCLHNTACQNTLAGLTVCEGIGCHVGNATFRDAKCGVLVANKHTKCLYFCIWPFSLLCLYLEFKSPESRSHMRKKHKPTSQDWIHRMWRDCPYCTH